MDDPDAFLEGDCAEDMGALLAMSPGCWEDCSAPIISGLFSFAINVVLGRLAVMSSYQFVFVVIPGDEVSDLVSRLSSVTVIQI